MSFSYHFGFNILTDNLNKKYLFCLCLFYIIQQLVFLTFRVEKWTQGVQYTRKLKKFTN